MNTSAAKVRLKKGREKPVVRGHPWVFSGAVESVDGEVTAGAVADVTAHDGTWLARGLLHPEAALRVRLYTRRADQALDDAFFAARLDDAVALRERLFGGAAAAEGTDAYRLVYSESDGLSGLIVDRYADSLAVQVGARALLPRLDAMLAHLSTRTAARRVHVSVEEEAVMREGMDPAELRTDFPAGAPPVRIRESGFQFDVDFQAGQKTGFFLDQRVNRRRVAAYARGRSVLSAYCYTGAFEVYAAGAGASRILGLDRSESAIRRAEEHHRINGTAAAVDYMKADVPEALRRFRDAGRSFELIILDPPRFVANQKQLEKGLRAYKDINLLAMKLLAPGGILATFSCSGLVSIEQFSTMIGWASVDAGVPVRILETLGQPPDHPVLAVFPESAYLKGFICCVG
jgi:23S rRNA (cytosine1962-C5)-methyltransferase